MKTRCCRCRKLINFGDRFCDDCKKIVVQNNKKNLRNKEVEATTKNARWKALRKAILLRDKCCLLCLKKHNKVIMDKLQVHHIVKRVDDESLIYEPTNLVTVCRSCHEEVEKLNVSTQKEMFGTISFIHDFKL